MDDVADMKEQHRQASIAKQTQVGVNDFILLNWKPVPLVELLGVSMEKDYYGVIDNSGLACFMPSHLWFDPNYVQIRGGGAAFWLPWSLAGGRMGSENPVPFKVTLYPTQLWGRKYLIGEGDKDQNILNNPKQAVEMITSDPTFEILAPWNRGKALIFEKVIRYVEEEGTMPSDEEMDQFNEEALKEMRVFLKDNEATLKAQLEEEYGFDFI
tara:strand:+ start:1843 stop:2478 length:636 start_codon:yes stop_codon:yes gene_type:complete